MVRISTLLAFVACSGVEGARQYQRQQHESEEDQSSACFVPAQSRVGQAGVVDFAYTFGAPGIGSPALRNPMASDGCFPGLRLWISNGTGATGMVVQTDAIVLALNPFNFWHNMMPAENVRKGRPTRMDRHSCSQETTALPSSRVLSLSVHEGPHYVSTTSERNEIGRFCDRWTNATVLGRTGAMTDPGNLARLAVPMGWRMVGDSIDNVHPQAQLYQEPATLDCMLMFRGTEGLHEWIENGALATTKFCGYAGEDDDCSEKDGDCPVNKQDGGFTHFGFTMRLRRIVRSNLWRTSVLQHLGSCNKMYVVGHSAGGAMASLFQACVARAPGPNDFGHRDYSLMQWTRGQPRQLPYVPV